jgi:hypothetical protein
METSIYKDTWEKIQGFQSWRQIIKQLQWIEEDLTAFYEFGVYTGKSIVEILDGFKEVGKKVDIVYGFDSFEGLPERTNKEREEAMARVGAYQWKAGDFNSHEWHGVDDARVHLEKVFDTHLDTEVKFIEGWYEDTLNKETVEKYDLPPALFIDIDVDIYSSCVEVLDFIFQNNIAVPGTILGFDDWGGTPQWKTMEDGGPKACKEAIEKYNLELQQVMQWGVGYPHVASAFLVKSIDGKDCGYMYEKTLHIR